MDYADMRETILDAINNKGLKSFTFEDLIIMMEAAAKEKGREFSFDECPDYQHMLTEVVRELVVDRVISAVPHGAPTFFATKKC